MNKSVLPDFTAAVPLVLLSLMIPDRDRRCLINEVYAERVPR